MCGITGGTWTDPSRQVSRDTLAEMVRTLRHRGPDSDGIYYKDLDENGPGVALGFRRLAVIDLQDGMQPISNEDNTVWMVFNGEIYNYLELRPELERQGHRFRTRSDSEVIVHLYEQLGTDCFQRLNGMFAVAIWDGRSQTLVLARDRLGQKPLVYRQDKDGFVFASELKSLLTIPRMPREVDPHALVDMTWQILQDS